MKKSELRKLIKEEIIKLKESPASVTQIWYMKKNFFNQGIWGYDALSNEGKLPDPQKLEKTHVMVYDTNETNLDKLFKMANSPNWFDTPEEQKKLKSLGVSHTSMSIGDIIVTRKKVYMVDTLGFKELK